jgi:hypothetical protein
MKELAHNCHYCRRRFFGATGRTVYFCCVGACEAFSVRPSR